MINGRYDNKVGTAQQLNNLGIVYRRQGRYDEALEHYHQSLEMKYLIGDEIGTADTSANIGSIHEARGSYDDALKHYQRSLQIPRA